MIIIHLYLTRLAVRDKNLLTAFRWGLHPKDSLWEKPVSVFLSTLSGPADADRLICGVKYLLILK
jgi:hypothetical protein